VTIPLTLLTSSFLQVDVSGLIVAEYDLRVSTMGSSRGFALVAWSSVREERVLRIEGARICKTREVLGGSWMEEKRSSSWAAGERNARREDRISR
jgi:hypothetical protein